MRQLELGLKTTSGVADVSSCCDSISSNHLHLYTFFCAVADFVHISTCLYGQISLALGSSRLCSPITAIRGRLLNRGWCLILLPFHIINNLPLYTGQGPSSAECWHYFAPSLYRKKNHCRYPIIRSELLVTWALLSCLLSVRCPEGIKACHGSPQRTWQECWKRKYNTCGRQTVCLTGSGLSFDLEEERIAVGSSRRILTLQFSILSKTNVFCCFLSF